MQTQRKKQRKAEGQAPWFALLFSSGTSSYPDLKKLGILVFRTHSGAELADIESKGQQQKLGLDFALAAEQETAKAVVLLMTPKAPLYHDGTVDLKLDSSRRGNVTQGVRARKSETGFVSTSTIYRCKDCAGCALRQYCTRAKDCKNKQLEVNHDFVRLRHGICLLFGSVHKQMGVVKLSQLTQIPHQLSEQLLRYLRQRLSAKPRERAVIRRFTALQQPPVPHIVPTALLHLPAAVPPAHPPKYQHSEQDHPGIFR